MPVLSINPRFLHIALDLSNTCNLRCRFCYLSLPASRGKTIFLTAKSIHRQLQHLLPFTRRLCLSCGYEPLASPHFTEILAALAPYHIPQLDLVTNATLLSEDKIEAMIRNGVQTLRFSLDSADKTTYESIRRGACFETVIANIKRLAARKKALGSRTPSLAMIVVLMQSNLHQLNELVDLAIELGVASITLQHLIPFPGLHMESEVITDKDAAAYNALIGPLREHAQRKRIFLSAPNPFHPDPPRRDGWLHPLRSRASRLGQAIANARMNPGQHLPDMAYGMINHGLRLIRRAHYPAHPFCRNPFNYIIMTPEGRAKACPYLDDAWLKTFDADRPLTSVFLGNEYQALRQTMMDGGPHLAPCLKCPDCQLSNTHNRI